MSNVTQTANSGPGYARAPGHILTLEPAGQSWTAVLNGEVIAQSDAALIMREGDYDPVVYFPPADVRLDLARQSDHSSYCPFKGEASYWSFAEADEIAWAYLTPYDEMIGVKGYVAFYKDRLDSLS
jgi:uncharacterized protein (DUF427 family)